MTPLQLAAITRKLRSPGRPVAQAEDDDTTEGSITIVNGLCIPLYLYVLDGNGQQTMVVDSDSNPVLIEAGTATTPAATIVPTMLVGFAYNLLTAYSGAYVTSFTVTAVSSSSMPITQWVLTAVLLPPNDIGPLPEASVAVPIPPDSPRILVGCAVLPNGNLLCREQYWKRGDDSYAMAPGTKRTVSTTRTSGLQKTSTEQHDVSMALCFSASAGWGPISASISGSISSTSSTMQQVFISSEVTEFESLELKNDTTDTLQVLLSWQLMDVYTIFAPEAGDGAETPMFSGPVTPPANSPGGAGPIACIILAESPTLISGYAMSMTLNPLPPTG